MKIVVIIVNYNVKYYLEQCLVSVYRALDGLEGKVIVFDNHSSDGSIKYLRRRFPKVQFIDSNHNLGFSRANNIAIEQTESEYVLLLNPDTFICEDTLHQAIQFMDAHPQAGGAGVMMFNSDGTLARESRRGLPTPYVSLLKMLGKPSRYYMSHLPWDKPARIDVISGAFCLLRRSALNLIGHLDEDFFMYGEDIDLSYRLLKGGYENWYLPLPIVHYKGESTQKSSYRYVHIFYQAMLIFFRKHYGHLSFIITLPIKAAIYLRALMALFSMEYWLIRKSLGFFGKRPKDPVYVFQGSRKMTTECHRLARRKGLTETTDTNAPNCCIVMDTDNDSFTNIIDRIRSLSRKGLFLGTYSCRSRILITPTEIIQ